MAYLPREIRVNASGAELTAHGTPELPCGCYLCDPLVNITPWHWHDEYEFVYVTCGSMRYSVGSERYVLHEGDAVFVNAGVPHAEEAYQGKRSMEVDLVCHPRMLFGPEGSALWQRYYARLALPSSVRAQVLRKGGAAWEQQAGTLILEAWRALAAEESCYELTLRENLTRVALLVLEHAAASAPAEEHRAHESATNRVERMLSFVDEHYAEPLTLANIAAAGGISEREAQREFAEVIGESPLKHLVAHRLTIAVQLLLSTDEPVGAIARSCGFSGQSYFNRCFRERYGCTPKEYRAIA